jgi:hypothetical protein
MKKIFNDVVWLPLFVSYHESAISAASQDIRSGPVIALSFMRDPLQYSDNGSTIKGGTKCFPTPEYGKKERERQEKLGK